jgi:hypothetical protein
MSSGARLNGTRTRKNMRNFSHITPRYVVDRISYKAFELRNPGKPWLAQPAVAVLNTWLKPTDRMLEFGSGRSTAWFASKVGHITSVEHHKQWHEQVSEMFAAKGLRNIDYRHIAVSDKDSPTGNEAYFNIANEFAPESLDVVLVDGLYRGECTLAAIPKIKRGGMLAIDNVNWFLPSTTRAANSRRAADGPLDENWKKIGELIAPWRTIWTENGLSDTALFIKP